MGNILLGVSGGIAAYKTAELVRHLVKHDQHVRVVMTAAAQQFVTPLTFQALSGNPVSVALLDPDAEAGMGHIALTRWADQIVIAPASANTLAKLAYGIADNLLTTIGLAASCPIAVAPAMNQGMWHNPATQANLLQLRARGVHIWGPAEGEQACGDTGLGRMLEPIDLLECILANNARAQSLAGIKVLITAGPTREAIDPVRYISNHSSGKMGFALAAAANAAGAEVCLVKGPTSLFPPAGVEVIEVTSAAQMLAACEQKVASANIFIATAAVADYRVQNVAEEKIKKPIDMTPTTLTLVQNPDILASMTQKKDDLFSVGFAAETQNIVEYARQKLLSKKVNMIIANNVSTPGAGFNSDNNEVTVVTQNDTIELPLQSKAALAQRLIDMIVEQYQLYKRLPSSGGVE